MNPRNIPLEPSSYLVYVDFLLKLIYLLHEVVSTKLGT